MLTGLVLYDCAFGEKLIQDRGTQFWAATNKLRTHLTGELGQLVKSLGGQVEMQLVEIVECPLDDPLDISVLQFDAEDDLLADTDIDF